MAIPAVLVPVFHSMRKVCMNILVRVKYIHVDQRDRGSSTTVSMQF